MIKTIYILWFQGFPNAPFLVKRCLSSWKYYNARTWKIVLLSEKNISEYVPMYSKYVHINKTALSDIIRISLLFKYGGLWVDATTFCNKPLDDWLPNLIQPPNSIFAFYKPTPDKELSSWFLYFNEPFNYISKKWITSTIDYFAKNKQPLEYFWFHKLFEELYKKDKQFKKLWENVPKVSSDKPHSLQQHGLNKIISKELKKDIKEKTTPLYKLTYKTSMPTSSDKNITLNFLFSTIP